MNIVPVILAGGSGTRLWPLSREAYPKQFLKLSGQWSLLQGTVLRQQGLANVAKPLIICNEKHYFMCLDQLHEINVGDVNFILEPVAKNTAPAIALAAEYVKEHYDEDAVMLVMPSDHLITDKAGFTQVVEKARNAAAEGALVTFGIKPTEPKTGYGYIESGTEKQPGCYQVQRFVEKPDLANAERMIAGGNYYWNSGIFMFSAQNYLDELQKHSADLFQAAQKSYTASSDNNNFLRIDAHNFKQCPSDSIDYAVMEKTAKAMVIPFDGAWNDLGCWASVAETGELDENNNSLRGNVIARDSENCLISSEERMVAAIGLKDQIVVSTPDAVLVADKAYSQQVKQIVEQLKQSQSELTTHHRKVHRPWGYYETLVKGDNFQVKRIMVKPGAKLSLQLHHQRAEHWVVVDGVADVICGEDEFQFKANQSTYIPKQTKHRLSNNTDKPLHIIEVQSGDYLGEDDIVRFDDVYERDKVGV